MSTSETVRSFPVVCAPAPAVALPKFEVGETHVSIAQMQAERPEQLADRIGQYISLIANGLRAEIALMHHHTFCGQPSNYLTLVLSRFDHDKDRYNLLLLPVNLDTLNVLYNMDVRRGIDAVSNTSSNLHKWIGQNYHMAFKRSFIPAEVFRSKYELALAHTDGARAIFATLGWEWIPRREDREVRAAQRNAESQTVITKAMIEGGIINEAGYVIVE